eukprot:4256943-Lingulodinium_polyedra.AAC.1
MALPVFQQTYVGLCVFSPPLSSPVSKTIDVAFERCKQEAWGDTPFRARLNVQAYFGLATAA